MAVNEAAGRRREGSVRMCGNQLTAPDPRLLRFPSAAADVAAAAKPNKVSAPHKGGDISIVESGIMEFFCSPQVHA
ncbi:hypothetical protein Pure05_38040 [Paenarthrobacter ureafaciens]|nr:hypothetical protein Pure01_38060 [Paenarthrobacter ureafaciens]GLU65506.1 hypothetical protein Pure02_37560 [Paenarthrobacter ureafaciens]GLU69701.1 hypothetical protein Pure03_36770 [Paenarthrobacter ureafaciens]GLU74123.1 hypothetical protein Pure04_38380 [Paenarthrobacter ureafaciens]GLU78364.1 hypothetical protein Pure05_38040 [Paenarthrobacter ureafaciens]